LPDCVFISSHCSASSAKVVSAFERSCPRDDLLNVVLVDDAILVEGDEKGLRPFRGNGLHLAIFACGLGQGNEAALRKPVSREPDLGRLFGSTKR
jgi:hypothetical protein